MKLRIFLITSTCAAALSAGITREDAVRILDMAPLRFEPAATGQPGRFIARGTKGNLSFASNQVTLRAGTKRLQLRFEGAAPNARVEPTDKLASVTALYLGNDPSKWRPSIPNYSRLQVRDLYPGIDLVYYGNAGQLEYDLTVKAGVDPRRIRLRLEGASARVDQDGNLVSDLIQKRPVAYQMDASGSKIAVPSRYRRNADGSYGFVLGKYDRSRELVIDPALTFSQYLSGNYQMILKGIGLDSKGYVYVAGTTYATDMEVDNHIQGANNGIANLFVFKIDPANYQVPFATYLGGSSSDTLNGMAVSPSGDIYLTGSTISGDVPLQNAAQTALDGTSDAFVVWINTSNALAYSTYLGGSGNDTGMGITYDSKGQIYVTGGTQSTDFPGPGAFQTALAGEQDAFVARYDPSRSGSASLVYATYLGGGGWDVGNSIALLQTGIVWVAGGTFSDNFPIKGSSFQPTSAGSGDGFVARLNTDAGPDALEYSSYLGGSSVDQATNVAIDSKGRVIVTGWTQSQDFPVSANAMQAQYGGNTDIFITILQPANAAIHNLVYSTYLGGSGPDLPTDLKQDASGNLYICGYSLSAGLPTTKNAAQPAYDGSMDAFALKFTPPTAGTAAIDYLTYLGSDGVQQANGIAFDSKGNIYLAGFTSGPIFSKFGGETNASPGQVNGFIAGLSTK